MFDRLRCPRYTPCVTFPALSDSPANTVPNAAADSPEKRERFARELLDWYDRNRRDLPWRRNPDPYAVWVSEMMLQQTQVATVIPYWTRWMERFPTVRELAAAPLDDVLKQWQGLGYYARARNLHRAAQVIMEKHGGVFPTRYDEVLALPGIGRYTAGAVCSIALGLDTPIVDANVIRVLCRIFGLRGDPKSASVQERLWELAADLIPSGRASAFNQGMMELGALVCQAKPRCAACPVNDVCAAYASGKPESLPEFAPKPVFTLQTDVSAIVRHPSGDGRLLLVRRPEGGLWGGLHEFPRVTRTDDETNGAAAERAARETAGVDVRAAETVLGTVRHGVTTRKITLVGVACELKNETPLTPAAGWAAFWVPLAEIDRYALSSPQARLMEQIREKEAQPTLF
jgi:A/G-specific adenine glycosylase